MAAKRIYVAGHKGMVGGAILRKLEESSDAEIITRDRCQLDLVDQSQVNNFFSRNNIDEIYLAAARVGGIHANNSHPADFIYENLMIEANVINAAHRNDIDKLLFLGSSCIYPKMAEQPMKEEALLTGTLEATNEPYAIAKIAGIKLCESYFRQYKRDYRSVMPTNLYGPGDNYHPMNSHVIPSLIRKFHEAKLEHNAAVEVWGSGHAMREFLYVDDLADACVFILNLDRSTIDEFTSPMLSHINVGSGTDYTIRELAKMISQVVGYDGKIIFDREKPDGAPRKLLNLSKTKLLGWHNSIALEDGLKITYEHYTK